MKQIILLIMISFSVQLASAQGIIFSSGDFDDIVKQAKEQKKGIFVDVYTSWCGPCKMMAKNVFTNTKVGEYYNTSFICIKLDAEKQREHVFFAKYKAGGYPSFFWLDENGDLLDLHVGYLEAETFIKKGKEAKESDFPKQLAAMKERWDKGERSIELVRSYVFKNLSKIDPDQAETCLRDYLSGLSPEELLSQDAYSVLRSFMRSPDKTIREQLIRHADVYKKYDDNFWINLYRAIVRVGSIIHNEKPEEYKQYITELKEIDVPLSTMYCNILAIEEQLFNHEFGKAIPAIIPLVQECGDEHRYLYSQLFYTMIIADYFRNAPVVDKEVEEVIRIADLAMKAQPCQEDLLYLAAAHAKREDFKQAYAVLASMPMFEKPMLSLALYRYLNLPFVGQTYR